MHAFQIRLAVSVLLSALPAYGQAADVTTFANDQLVIGIKRSTGGLADIAAADGSSDFIPTGVPAPFQWDLQFRSGRSEELRINNTQVPPPRIAREDATLTIEWKSLALGDEPGALDVKVTCELPSGSNTALLRLWVDNRSARWGLWDISFPVIAGLGKSGTTDVAMGRGTWGRLYQDPTETLRGDYPSHSLPMQFILVQHGDRGLCLAAHDPEAWFKTFTIQTGAEFRVTTRAADMGEPGNDWPAPYPFAISLYNGPWMLGCKQYRAWVINNAPWTRKGPLSARTDVPKHLTTVCAWLLANGGPGEVAPDVRQFAHTVGAPVGVHWYNWHEIPFDTFYPNYFPTKTGFPEAVKELVSSGVTVMPYINARLWDIANENFQEARPASVKNENGEVTIEEYGSGAKLAVMCPTQTLWQDKVEEIIHRLGEACGVNAVYLDQIASAPPRLCFDAGHGHALGSGAWWVDGYRALLTPIKRWTTSEGRAIALTTENNAEPYMDNVDGHLLWTPRSEDEIPMMTAVYSGYTVYFASNRAFAHGDTGYCLCQARDFVWGTQLGWDGVEILAPEHEGKLRFLARLAKLRARALDYFVHGELVEVFAAPDNIPALSGTWTKPEGDGAVTLPAVHGARWLGRDGSVVVALANADTASHTYTFPWAADTSGPAATTRWRVERVTVDGREELSDFEGDATKFSATVPARDGVLLIFRRANDSPAHG